MRNSVGKMSATGMKQAPRFAWWGVHSRFALWVAVAVFVCDHALKTWVLFGLGLPQRGQVPLLPFLDFVMVWNRGISYGLLQQHGDLGRWLLTALGLGASVLLWLWIAHTRSRQVAFAVALIVGGALANVLDRVLYGAVADFVRLFWGEWSWYVFNLADAAIVAGVLLLLYDSVAAGRDDETRGS